MQRSEFTMWNVDMSNEHELQNPLKQPKMWIFEK